MLITPPLISSYFCCSIFVFTERGIAKFRSSKFNLKTELCLQQFENSTQYSSFMKTSIELLRGNCSVLPNKISDMCFAILHIFSLIIDKPGCLLLIHLAHYAYRICIKQYIFVYTEGFRNDHETCWL